ncbi:ATPase inhibitor mai-2, mitochondrial-like [Rhodnius prolixus]|uniref:ATP synthase F1 subunit epsilon n=1 Tax=Rhodnius prolixus TaxID=13249 RepID=R4FL45_RHOPR
MSHMILTCRNILKRAGGFKESRCMMSQLGDMGEGAGKGGGAGGAIRSAGGAFGKREAAQEEEYFYKKQKEQLNKLKNAVKEEISFHEEQIKRHQEALSKAKAKLTEE